MSQATKEKQNTDLLDKSELQDQSQSQPQTESETFQQDILDFTEGENVEVKDESENNSENEDESNNEDNSLKRLLSPIREENKAAWIEWLEEQLDTTNNANHVNLQTNRVFLTEDDDIDIARYILSCFLDTLKMTKLTDISSL
jgi:hypothetical protein